MVQCEMCGTETASPSTIKVEGAELDVCEECSDFGTEVRQEDTTESQTTKYSTESTAGASDATESTSRTSSRTASDRRGNSQRRGNEMLEDVADLATDYDDRIRNAREEAGLSREELADRLNEKASLIGKLERGDTLPSDEVQREIEGELDVSLSSSSDQSETDEWEADASTGEYTLGDVVERND